MLRYTLRVRDLVHGTILFTELEQRIINHPFFQRLRQIRQNDVAFYVYPSLHTSRFEHVLGTCRVAGMMAENLTESSKWKKYLRELKAETDITSAEEFIELSRLYALLHDIGHPPLSHLFEMAVVRGSEEMRRRTVEEWTGVSGFEKLHEAFGAVIVRRMVQDLKFSKSIRNAFVTLMTEKVLPDGHPLSVVKLLVDSDIDADRIDFVQRDGLLAGGEYGHYDIRRLCDSVFIQKYEQSWIIAYSEKALTSMEALLLDRYRTHVWIHFHHRVVAMKMLVRFLIEKALGQGIIKKEQFDPTNQDMFSLRDDVWLWNVLREMEAKNDIMRIIQRAVFYREKKNIINLWKTRPAYHALHKTAGDKADVAVVKKVDKLYSYQPYLSRQMKVQALVFEPPFKSIGEKAIRLYSEAKKKLTGKNLLEVSRLIADLERIWEDEPQYFILLIGRNIKARAKRIGERWIDLTADWIRSPRLL